MDAIGMFSLFFQIYFVAVTTLIFVGLFVLLSLVVDIYRGDRQKIDTRT